MEARTKSAIISFGTATPRYTYPQNAVAELISTSLNLKPAERRLLKSVYRSTGIDQRYSVLKDYCANPGEFEFFPNDADVPFPSTQQRMKVYRENALALALHAIAASLASLDNFNLAQITHVITVSCTGMYAPGLDIEIVQNLNLNLSVKRTVINFMGCYGAFNAIKVADAICKAEPESLVLIVCLEICTIHFQKNMSRDNIIAHSIFADGAAAIIMQANPQQRKYLTLEHFHCDLLPKTNDSMTWEIADSGFDIVLSSYVPEIIDKGIQAFFKKLISTSRFKLEDIDFFAIHPGAKKILQACEKALNISEEQNKYSYRVLKQYGNMSSPTVLFVLKAIWDELDLKDQRKNIYSCAFGPGLTLESMLLKIHV